MPIPRRGLPPGAGGPLGRVPWARVYQLGRWALVRANQGLQQLTAAERRELGELLRKSKGRRSNLTQREAQRLWRLVKKAFPGV